MNNVIEDLRNSFQRKDTVLQLIFINVGVFVAALLVQLIFFFSGDTKLLAFQSTIVPFIGVPGDIAALPIKFYTLFTYSFTHIDIWHLVGNMLGLYWFGQIIYDLLGSKRLISLYLLGGLAGAVVFLLCFNLIPVFKQYSLASMVGASACIYAIVVGAATIAPDYSVYLMFLGAVRLKYLAMFFILLSSIGIMGVNPGGNIAHLGGALMGYLYIVQLKKGNDWGYPFFKIAQWFGNIGKSKSKLKVVHKNYYVATKDAPNQEEIDKILDKINASGYNSLSKEEKEKLFKASQG